MEQFILVKIPLNETKQTDMRCVSCGDIVTDNICGIGFCHDCAKMNIQAKSYDIVLNNKEK